jgi:hypothetical protein
MRKLVGGTIPTVVRFAQALCRAMQALVRVGPGLVRRELDVVTLPRPE